MKNPFPHLAVEMAKDGNPTLKHFKGEYWHYVYSKYCPKKSLELPKLDKETPCLLLSFGLGYELEQILSCTKSDVYVLEMEQMWIAFLRGLSQTQPLLLNKRVHVFYSIESLPKNMTFTVIVGNHAMYSLDFYGNFLYKRPKADDKRCMLFPKIPFLYDCAQSFELEGYLSFVEPILSFEKLCIEVATTQPDLLFSLSYYPELLRVAEYLDLPYLCWCFDTSPFVIEEPSEKLSIFHYDKEAIERLRMLGHKQAHYLPFGISPNKMKPQCVEENKVGYSDVTFFGSSCHDTEWKRRKVDERMSLNAKNLLQFLLKEQDKSSSEFAFSKIVTDEHLKTLQHDGLIFPSVNSTFTPNDHLMSLLYSKWIFEKRKRLLTSLGHYFQTSVYGDENWKSCLAPKLQYFGFADPNDEIPLIISRSKINISFWSHQFPTSIPFRVFEVLAVSGFLVAQDQKQLRDFFTDGEHCIFFRDEKDLIEMTRYYLNHPKERKLISLQGHRALLSSHNISHRIHEMLTTWELSQVQQLNS